VYFLVKIGDIKGVPFIFAGRSARSVVYKLLEFFVKYNILGFKTIEEFEKISRWEAI